MWAHANLFEGCDEQPPTIFLPMFGPKLPFPQMHMWRISQIYLRAHDCRGLPKSTQDPDARCFGTSASDKCGFILAYTTPLTIAGSQPVDTDAITTDCSHNYYYGATGSFFPVTLPPPQRYNRKDVVLTSVIFMGCEQQKPPQLPQLEFHPTWAKLRLCPLRHHFFA